MEEQRKRESIRLKREDNSKRFDVCNRTDVREWRAAIRHDANVAVGVFECFCFAPLSWFVLSAG